MGGAQQAAPLFILGVKCRTSRFAVPGVSPLVTRSPAMPDRPHYYQQHELPRFGEIERGEPELARTFFDWYGAVFAVGKLRSLDTARIAHCVTHMGPCHY